MTDGKLLIVGTPIGNLADLSPRGLDALQRADAIACEDTRRTGRLLTHFGVPKKPLLVSNEHTERHRSSEIVQRIQEGQVVVLVTDAGMPGVSDPGRIVVAAAVDAGLPVEVVPGPTALIAGLVLSGLVSDRFVFEGFLPRKGLLRRTRLAEIASETRTVVFYESPKRVAATLVDLMNVCLPDRPVAVAREITKLYEEVDRGSLADVSARFSESVGRGEYVVVLAAMPPDETPLTDDDIVDQLRAHRATGASNRDAVAAVVAATGEPKRRVYDLANSLDC